MSDDTDPMPTLPLPTFTAIIMAVRNRRDPVEIAALHGVTLAQVQSIARTLGTGRKRAPVMRRGRR